MNIKRILSKIIPFFMVADSHPAKSSLYKKSGFDHSKLYASPPSKHIYPVIQIGMTKRELEVQNLCLVSLNDIYYDTMELQEVIKDGCRNFIIIMYCESFESGKVDIYYPNGSGIESYDYSKMFNEIKMIPCHFKAQMILTERGLYMELSFIDVYGRKHEYMVKENRNKNDFFGMIAPIGGNLNIPEHFPLVYMKQFNFVMKRKTNVRIIIDGSSIKPQNMIPFVNFHRVYLIRYSFSMVNRSWNPTYNGTLDAVSTKHETIHALNSEYLLENNNGYSEIRSVISTCNEKEMKVSFYPALPDFEAMKDTNGLSGYFAFDAGGMNDILGGEYCITKKGKRVLITMNPSNGYSPMPGKPWMANYYWTGILQFDSEVFFTSRWEKR